jgi:peptidoglycan/xylan/chitin deacetylase (PgdA/CDA1 family)
MTTVCLTFDFDAFSIWMSTFKQATPTSLSRGEYSGRVGIVRVLEMLERHDVPATFFVPAHSAATYPEIVGGLPGMGHEVANHGFHHESPVGLDKDAEEELLLRSREVLETACGIRPVGYRSPAFDLSDHSAELLEKHGYLYDSSMMADDFTPYFIRRGDQLGEDRFRFGEASGLIEFPVSWDLDDFPYFFHSMKLKLPSLRRAADVYDIWADEFDYCDQKVDGGLFNLTCHPEVIGRGPRIEMLGRLIAHMRSAGATFSTLSAAADSLVAMRG